MKRLFSLLASLLWSLVICSNFSVAQLTGTKAIPGDYATITAAVADLNTVGIGAGGVTFNVAAGYTEPIAARINLTATGTAGNPIIFQKNGAGLNPLITAYAGGTGTPGTATPDGMWSLQGSDYVTIDGIDLLDLNAANPATMEYGYGLFKNGVADGAQNNTIKNCQITLNRVNNAGGTAPMQDGSIGILVINSTPTAATTAIIPTSASGANNANKFYSNNIQNCNIGIGLSGYAAATPFTLGDTGNDIGGSSAATGNSILNYGGGGTTSPAAGIRANSQWGVNISYNTINNNTGSGLNHGTTLRGIYAQAGTSANATINNNTVTIKSAATTSAATAIENAIGTTAAGNTVTINNNTVQNCTYTTSTTGILTGIQSSASAATVNMNGNTVTGNSVGTVGTASSCSFYGIYSSSTPTNLTMNNNTITNNQVLNQGGVLRCLYASTSVITVNGNTINNNSFPSNDGTLAASLYGYYNLASATVENLTNNNIDNLTISGSSTSTGSIIYGIYSFTVSTDALTFSGNTIHTMTFNNTSTGAAAINGLRNSSGGTVTFSKNKIYNLTSNGASSTVFGIYIGSGATVTASNNLIGNLSTPSANAAIPLAGINVAGSTTTNLYYNTVYLNATSTGALFGSAAVYASTTPTLTMRNNIFTNLSTPVGATGFTAAYRRTTTTLTTYGAASNNNDFYAGTPGVNNLIFYDGTNSDQTLGAYQTRVTPRDAGSFTENPTFVSTTGSNPNFLHINTIVPTQIESAGATISGITDDYDGDLRSASTPDVGADEFAGVGLDLSAPNIVYSPLGNTALTVPRTLTATITDPSGVPTAGIGLPVLYWKINAGAYSPATAAFLGSGQYQFSFGAGVVTGDVVSYFVCAQDNVPNVGSNPSGGSGYTPNPPAASTPPGSPNTYTVVGGISGAFTVGTAGTYATLKAAFDDINVKSVTGNITLTVLASGTTEAATAVLNQVSYDGGPFTITVKPDPAAASSATPTITGSIASGAIIKLNGADNVIIDGSTSGGSDRSMTISNTSATSPTVIWLASLGAGAGATNNTIKNCVIQSGVNTTGAYGICIGGSTIGSAGDDNDNVTIQNNSISKAYYGIYASAGATGVNNNLFIRQNSIGSAVVTDYIGFTGIYVAQGTGGDISQNTIFNIIGTTTNPCGINLNAGFVNATVSRNDIHSIRYTGTGGYGGKGIDVNIGSASAGLTIANNIMYDLLGDGWSSFGTDAIVGIKLNGTIGGVNIYFNSVNLAGNADRASTLTLNACLYISATATTLNIRNNIFANSIVNNLNAAGKSYTIYSAAANTAFSNINYNDYFASGTQGVLGFLTADQATITAWRTATGQDANSIAADPLFSGPSNLVPFLGSPVLDAGVAGTGITVDYTGATRIDPPSMGAYENGVASGPPNCATIVSPTNAATNVSIAATLNWANGGGGPTGYKLFFGTDNPPTNIVNGTNLGNVLTYNPTPDMAYLTTYYWKIVPTNSAGDATGCPVWSFTTEANPTILTFPHTENFDGVTAPALPAGWSVENTNGDVNAWITSTIAPRSAPNAMTITYNTTLAMDDWFFTPPVQLTAGTAYRVRFWYRAASASFPERLEVKWGATPTSGGMTSGPIFTDANIVTTAYVEGTSTSFTPGSSGIFYIGWHGYSLADEFRLYVDDITIEVAPAGPPNCAGIVSPADAATGIAINATLNWSAPSGGASPTGYKLSFGTDNPPTNILNNSDRGNVLTYDPTPDMTFNTTYYWKVVPYNGSGDATGCAVWSFTTGGDTRTNASAPDGGGYYYSASNSTLTPRPNYDWASAGPTSPNIADSMLTGTNDDDVLSGVVHLPAPFDFYGLSLDSVRVSSNGFIVFVDGATGQTISSSYNVEALIPNTGLPNYIIAPLWDDLDTVSSVANAGVYVKWDAPAQKYTFEWFHFGRWSGSGTLGDMVFQVSLYYGDGTIGVSYASAGDGGFNYGSTNQGSVGIEGAGTAAASDKPIGFEIFGSINGKLKEPNKELEARLLEMKNTPGTSALLPLGTNYYFQGDKGLNIPTSGVTLKFATSLGGLPIQLASFTGTVVSRTSVRLNWTTLSEVNNYGFYIERRAGTTGTFVEVPNSFQSGYGTTNEPHHYLFVDNTIPTAGTYAYRLRQVDLDQTVHYTEPIVVNTGLTDVPETAPKEFSLKQNYPNPFNPTTEIKFSVENTGRATLEIYNLLGQKVATLFDDIAEAGKYQRVQVNASNFASGMYFYRLQSGTRSDLKKMLLLK